MLVYIKDNGYTKYNNNFATKTQRNINIGVIDLNGIRTDLAIEANEIYNENSGASVTSSQIPGVEINVEKYEHAKVTKVNISSDEGEHKLGKAKGNYITIEAIDIKLNSDEVYKQLRELISQELRKIITITDKSTILIVGLGNWNITPDALGPKVVSNVMVTRHIHEYMPEEIETGVRSTCAIAPGVLGITGVETGEIIKGVVDKVKPNIIIVIDALASRSIERVSKTIQISDTGICPGSGVGNSRKEFTMKTMGVPVIAIGVPTVVDAATIANDTIDKVINSLVNQSSKGKEFYETLKSIDKNEKFSLIQQVLGEDMANLMVTPKEIDDIINKISKVISEAI
ncbi:MAG TPA: GPR endopeptidase, partial [Clostridia bacterium]|nr:GPR endopeptidase [Clostridia bacterium]